MASMDAKGIVFSVISISVLAIIMAGCLRPNIITDSGLLNVTATATNFSVFIEAGCIEQGNGWLDCSSTSLDKRFSCEEMWVPKGLGGLSPKVQIVECNVLAKNEIEDTTAGIVRLGCMLPIFRKYIIFVDGEYKLIGSKEEFIQFFAPVESPEEALAFALALTGAYADYNMTIPEGYVVLASEIRTTYVEESGGNFKVHLFDMQSCGCGSHPYYSVDYTVTLAGDVNEISTEDIYQNPKLIGLCVD